MTINDLRELALSHGIIILDYENAETIASRIEDAVEMADGPLVSPNDPIPFAATDAVVKRVTEAMYATLPSLPLYTDLAEGEDEFRTWFQTVLVDAGVLPDDNDTQDKA